MQVEPKNNYNVLGRMGPTQPRPEYRPRSAPEGDSPKTGTDGGGQNSKSLERAKTGPIAASAESRLSLQAAKALTAETAQAIANLNPTAAKGPHSSLGPDAGLMYPRYV